MLKCAHHIEARLSHVHGCRCHVWKSCWCPQAGTLGSHYALLTSCFMCPLNDIGEVALEALQHPQHVTHPILHSSMVIPRSTTMQGTVSYKSQARTKKKQSLTKSSVTYISVQTYFCCTDSCELKHPLMLCEEICHWLRQRST